MKSPDQPKSNEALQGTLHPDNSSNNVSLSMPRFDLDISPFEKYEQLTVTTEREAAFVTDRISELKNHIAATEAQRMKYTKPLDALKKEMIRDERAITEPLERIMKIIKRKVRYWLESVEDERREAAEAEQRKEIARLEARVETKTKDAMEHDDEEAIADAMETEKHLERLKNKPAHVDTAIRGGSGVSALTRHWKHEVMDAELVPRNFLLVDEKALAKLARSEKDKAKVPGVRFYQITGLTQSK